MNGHRFILPALLALLAIGRSALAQVERDEMPEGIRQLIRVAEQAEQKVRRENGSLVEDEAARQYRAARRAARNAIREYWNARYDFGRAQDDADAAWRDAKEAQNHFLQVRNAPVPDAARLQNAEMDRDKKLDLVTDAEFKLEEARQALEAARRTPAGVTTPLSGLGSSNSPGSPNSIGSTSSRPVLPPGIPLPDYGTHQDWRLVYHSDQDSFHLMGRTGTAAFSRGGLSRLEPLDFVKESQHFLFYRPHAADAPETEWAFAKLAEMPAGDGVFMFAVWWRDRDGWHWEWTRRDGVLDVMPSPGSPSSPPPIVPPMPPIPGPVTLKSASAASPGKLATNGR